MTVTTWHPTPHRFDIRRDQVHVWRADLDDRAPELGRFAAALTADESQRAERYRFPRDRDRFIAGRGILRTVLSGYLAVSPAAIRFHYGQQGKPMVVDETGPNRLTFNVSHSASLALIAVTRGREVGVDVERRRPRLETDAIARRFFTEREASAICGLPEPAKSAAFLAHWTCKEALLKATGEGLALPLDQFEVDLTPGSSPVLRPMPAGPADIERWTVRLLDMEPGAAAAVAVEGAFGKLTCWVCDGLFDQT